MLDCLGSPRGGEIRRDLLADTSSPIGLITAIAADLARPIRSFVSGYELDWAVVAAKNAVLNAPVVVVPHFVWEFVGSARKIGQRCLGRHR